VRALLNYEPTTGVFTRKVSTHHSVTIGDVAGSTDSRGHINISIASRFYGAHRLAWLYMTGEWPSMHIDHINGVRDDNRWANLRHVTASVNMQNLRGARSNSKTGLLGVCPKGNIFEAYIGVKGRSMFLGCFKTAIEAHEAYVAAKRIHHEGCTI
jgi:hypothetical protein